MDYISLFSGAMGLDLGLKQGGLNCRVCVENDRDAAKTIAVNRPSIKLFDKSIADVSGANLLEAIGMKKGEVPLVVGGPPCQAFSVFGNRLGLNDARGQMLFEFLRVIDEVRPSMFLMENVRGLLSMSVIPKKGRASNIDAPLEYFESGSLINLLLNEFNKIGYSVDCFVVNSVNYGAPQIRERVLLIGNRFGATAKFPEPMFSNRPEDGLPEFRTLGQVIGSDFIDKCPELLNFSPRKLKYLSMVPPGGNWRSLPVDIQKESMGKSWYLKGGRSAYWRKLSFAFPSPTVVTMPNHAGTSMCHPTELRAITVGEAAAIQEFPAEWQFQGSTSAKFKQIGNAVPVRLGLISAGVIRQLASDIGSNIDKKITPSSCITHIRPHVRTRVFWKNGLAIAGDHSYYSDDEEMIDDLQLTIDIN